MWKITLAVLALALPLAAQADVLPAPAGHPCREQATGRALDFWVGDWTVTNADGTKAGVNRIVQTLGGCAVTENWHGVTAGDDGMSLFTYDARRHTWDQVWVTPDTSRAGGLKHKAMTGVLYAGAVRFEGTIVTPKGPLIDRTTLTPWRDGRVRQQIEWSKDNGRTWKTVFDAYYNRKGRPDLGAPAGGDPH
ncbi:MAG TPA: hypothetical protein VHU87_00220 [Rhizomicrobium sp.]|jgi:hypothetical protein|nr:hypothetical protein [Rhizomicrobium sp.]